MGWPIDDNPTEARQKAELKQALEIYERAKIEFDEASGNARSIGLDHPDGAYALQLATQRYASALSQYKEAVKRFSDFVLGGR